MDKPPVYLQKRPENGIYYFRRPIPPGLAGLVERKAFHHSLGTKIYREALKQHLASLLESENILARAIAVKNGLPTRATGGGEIAIACKNSQPPPSHLAALNRKPAKPFESLKPAQIRGFVAAWFAKERARLLEIYRNAFLHGSPEDRLEMEQGLDAEWRELSGDLHPMDEIVTLRECRSILDAQDTGFPEPKRGANPAFKDFYGLVKLGLVRLNDVARAALKTGQGPEGLGTPPELVLHASPVVHAAAGAPPAGPVRLLRELVDDFEKLKRAKKKETTVKALALPLRFIREVIGEDKPLPDIRREDLRTVAEAVMTYPKNAVQNYPGLSIADAIAAAKEKGAPAREPKTLRNNWTHIVSVFNYAVKDGWMKENPAKGSWFEDQFPKGQRKSDREPFKTADLKTIFSSPLYTGCKDDKNGFLTPGPRIIRRGRFWLPLLGLFHGLRLNEACQFLTEDIQGEGAELCLLLREEGADGKARADKSLKTLQSERLIPIHPELLKMGFAEYVAERRRASDSPRLFPTLPLGKTTNRYSNPASKWFGLFVSSVAPHCKERFHSFRHNFRDALRRAEVSGENAAKLGGWEHEGRTMNLYGAGPPMEQLRRDIAKVSYPGLDLSHLYVPSKEPPAARVRLVPDLT